MQCNTSHSLSHVSFLSSFQDLIRYLFNDYVIPFLKEQQVFWDNSLVRELCRSKKEIAKRPQASLWFNEGKNAVSFTCSPLPSQHLFRCFPPSHSLQLIQVIDHIRSRHFSPYFPHYFFALIDIFLEFSHFLHANVKSTPPICFFFAC
jgi:hypothetical protein